MRTHTPRRDGTHDAIAGDLHAEVTAMTADKFILVADDDEPSTGQTRSIRL